MYNIGTYFDAIYCINLKNRKDRWIQVKKEFKKIGIYEKVIKIDAVKKENGALGCLLSHRNVLYNAKEKKYKNILVFEDDVNFIGKPGDLEKTINDIKKEKWNILYLGGLFHLRKGKFQNITKNTGRVYGLWCTHAIAYNSNIFDTLLDGLRNDKNIILEYKTYDNWLISLQGKINCFAPKKIFASQKNLGSDIDSSCSFDRWQTNMKYRWIIFQVQPLRFLIKLYSIMKKLYSK